MSEKLKEEQKPVEHLAEPLYALPDEDNEREWERERVRSQFPHLAPNVEARESDEYPAA